MNAWDGLILVAVALLLFLALRHALRSRGSCSCGGNCAACSRNCAACGGNCASRSRDCGAKEKNVKNKK